MDDVKRFWGWVVSLAVVGGMWFGAVAINKVWQFWALIGAAAFLTILARLWPKAKQILNRIRDYPALDAQVKVLRDEVEVMRQQLANEKGRVDSERLKGLRQGRSEVAGILRANTADVPILKAVVMRNGQLLLMAAIADPKYPLDGALYYIKSELTDEIKGTVRVQGLDAPGSEYVLLECVQQRSAAFWDQLAARAELNPEVPSDVKLVQVTKFGDLDYTAAPSIQGVS
jgi:hypothetical protein